MFSERIASACYWYFCDIVFFFLRTLASGSFRIVLAQVSRAQLSALDGISWPETMCKWLQPQGASLRDAGGTTITRRPGPLQTYPKRIHILKINIFVLIMHSRHLRTDPLVSLAGVFFWNPPENQFWVGKLGFTMVHITTPKFQVNSEFVRNMKMLID